MTAVIIIRKTGEENWAEMIDCETKEEAKEVLESWYYRELYNQQVVYNHSICDDQSYGMIDGDEQIVFFLIQPKENPCFC